MKSRAWTCWQSVESFHIRFACDCISETSLPSVVALHLCLFALSCACIGERAASLFASRPMPDFACLTVALQVRLHCLYFLNVSLTCFRVWFELLGPLPPTASCCFFNFNSTYPVWSTVRGLWESYVRIPSTNLRPQNRPMSVNAEHVNVFQRDSATQKSAATGSAEGPLPFTGFRRKNMSLFPRSIYGIIYGLVVVNNDW